MLMAVAGGMRGKRGSGLPMSERVRLGSSATMECPARHCWVIAAADGGARRPGLLLEWRQTSGGQRWQGRVVYAAQLRAGEWAMVEEWVDAALLAPA
jgi:hypothetical protein